MKQHKSEIEWDVILSSRAVRILLCETAEDSPKLRKLSLYAKPSLMLLSKMVIYFFTAPFLGVWDYSCCLFPV